MSNAALMARILARCVEDGGCLTWPGAMAANTSPQVRDGRRTLTIRRFLYEQKVGPVPAGMMVGVTCECQRCVRHIKPMTRAEVVAKVVASGALSAPINGPRIAAGRRKVRKYDEATIAALRASELPTMELSRQEGINFSYLYKVRRGDARKYDQPNPFAGLLAANDNRRASVA